MSIVGVLPQTVDLHIAWSQAFADGHDAELTTPNPYGEGDTAYSESEELRFDGWRAGRLQRLADDDPEEISQDVAEKLLGGCKLARDRLLDIAHGGPHPSSNTLAALDAVIAEAEGTAGKLPEPKAQEATP